MSSEAGCSGLRASPLDTRQSSGQHNRWRGSQLHLDSAILSITGWSEMRFPIEVGKLMFSTPNVYENLSNISFVDICELPDEKGIGKNANAFKRLSNALNDFQTHFNAFEFFFIYSPFSSGRSHIVDNNVGVFCNGWRNFLTIVQLLPTLYSTSSLGYIWLHVVGSCKETWSSPLTTVPLSAFIVIT